MALTDFTARGHAPAPMDLPLKLWLARLAHGISPVSVALAYADWLAHLMVSPSKQADMAASALRKSLLGLQYAAPYALQGECAYCVEPRPQDKRFSPREWHSPPYSNMAQSFLLQDEWWTEAMTGIRGVSRHHEDVVAFTMRQWVDMWSPSNFVLSNPQVIMETLKTGGANLANGFANWQRDAVAVLSDARPRGVENFQLGETVAVTPGKVVFRNRLIELIQYEPATPMVHAEPVLIVPSWIMKYYILDLTPDDSLVKFLVDQGHTVYMVSWKNPGSEDRDLGLTDYVELGVMAALKAVHILQPDVGIHAMGYCLGGTLLAIAAAALGAKPGSPLKTVSLLAAQTDFHEPGELGLFIDESQIAFLEDLMSARGYLDGRQMAGAFALINSKDLVWSKLVHEYLMGAHTPMTALRAWNADATRMPARMHSEYLRQLYLRNDLSEGRFRLGAHTVMLEDLTVPLFVVATERDHVSPWTSVYKIHRLAHAPVTFVLSSGGHNVGIVNPPSGPLAHPQASYRFASHLSSKAPADPLEWLEAAQPVQGSWWTCWHEWLVTHSTAQVKAVPVVAPALAGPPVNAPGSYVHEA
jgi:polyhydroxyalkanoate synthase